MWDQGAQKGDPCHCWKVWGRDKCKGVYPGPKADDGDDDDQKIEDDEKVSDHNDDDNDANDSQRIVNSINYCPFRILLKSITHRHEPTTSAV